MKKYIVIFFFVIIAIMPVYANQSFTSYNDMQSRQETPYLRHNAECVSFDGLIWTRNYGMKEYFISPERKPMLKTLLKHIHKLDNIDRAVKRIAG